MTDIDLKRFRVLVSWLYNVELPICDVDSALSFGLMDIAYKTADQLMAVELQNKLVDLHIEGMRQVRRNWWFSKLEILKDLELAHTPYYQLMLKSVVKAFQDQHFTVDEFTETLGQLSNLNDVVLEVMTALFSSSNSVAGSLSDGSS